MKDDAWLSQLLHGDITLYLLIFHDNHQKTKRFYMGGMGALFARNFNKTNNKQHIIRGYDSECGTTI
ncbi:hypothetical protein [Citrobacter sp. Igbk 16]|uniref:hypothetical protein n=1 Tax=Citrobacter sp. Igbk 16 TaxID=2963958 RepID=UPI0023033673|nr:hypothetical protein [Citrobacter sp. Igbk 16]MDA8518764.1 hypothetical protein [Citrobacter sp. Igbk 16]